MWYAIMSVDVDNSLELRARVRADHLARVRELVEQGRLLIAGPHPAVDAEDPGPAGFTGSLIIAEFPSLAEATSWANDDPYVKGGVYRSVNVKPFKRVLP